jgi:Arc/MetJ-type ribon-helix-helix transcriptional regulator
MNGKQRLSASVDADLIEAAEDAVASGRSGSVSAWVNEALRAKCDQDRRLEALDAFVRAYEREHGEIAAEEMELAVRRARARATPVRGARAGKGLSVPRRRRAR